MAGVSKAELAELLPREIVAELDRYIIGQNEAKRAVAIAMRNRYRRERLPEELRDEVVPKNILMIGPTGVGKTEIARRLAKMANAPFVKVEATKYTEVGYVGRDVESMIRDLADVAVHMVSAEHRDKVREKACLAAEERVIKLLNVHSGRASRGMRRFPLHRAFPSDSCDPHPDSQAASIPQAVAEDAAGEETAEAEKDNQLRLLRSGKFDQMLIELETQESAMQDLQLITNSGVENLGVNFSEVLGDMLPKRTKKRRVTVKEALEQLQSEEESKLIDEAEIFREALHRAENRGIVFVDELDKIAGKSQGSGPDVSREGVQRDILPIVEGSTVATKYGPVHTDHILFIAAGAFHVAKPSELIPELQGRFPIRVSLTSLEESDLRRILVEPENSLTRQYVAMLATEGIELVFAAEGIEAMAQIANSINKETENIGARRLHTVVERVLEKVSFAAADLAGETIVIDADYVRKELGDIVDSRDLSRFIL